MCAFLPDHTTPERSFRTLTESYAIHAGWIIVTIAGVFFYHRQLKPFDFS